MDPARHPLPDEIGLIASAAAVPLLVVDYSPILERFSGRSVQEIELLLADDAELLVCLKLPRELAASPEWALLYGRADTELAPDLVARNFFLRGLSRAPGQHDLSVPGALPGSDLDSERTSSTNGRR